jgi:hypothetical protein
MKSISADIKQLLVSRIEQSTPAEILRIASGLAANETIEAISAGHAARITPPKAPAASASPSCSRTASVWLDPQDGECVAVYDSKTNLTWSHASSPGGSRNWKDSLAAAAAVRLLGKDDWRAPTLEERLSINDYTTARPRSIPSTSRRSRAGSGHRLRMPSPPRTARGSSTSVRRLLPRLPERHR